MVCFEGVNVTIFFSHYNFKGLKNDFSFSFIISTRFSQQLLLKPIFANEKMKNI